MTSSSLALIGCEACTPIERIRDALVIIESGKIAWAGPRGAVPPPAGAETVSLQGGLVCPGFIDLQVNGLGEDSLLAGDPEAVSRVARALARRGTAAFLPTLTSDAPERLLAAAGAVRRAWESRDGEGEPAAAILGLHLEGPYIAPKMRGAHPAAHVRPLDLGEIERIAEAAGGFGPEGRPGLRLLTLSPEVEGAPEAARRLTERGVVIAIGHTAAEEAQVQALLEAGARFAVHAFNRYAAPGAVPAPFHRAPGPMAAVLSDPRLTAGLIADGAHVHPQVAAAFLRARGWERTALTSDLASAPSSPEPPSDAAAVRQEDAAVRREGVLAGSRLSLGEMLPLLREWTDLDPGRLIATATRNPARLLGLSSRGLSPPRGLLAPGAAADLCVLAPATLELRAAMAGGRWSFGREVIANQ
ncbi:MAG: amidohydrolase family protein [bacterium]